MSSGYLQEDFLNDVTRRVFGWQEFYDKMYRNTPNKKLGLFATIYKNSAYCSNTGIYDAHSSLKDSDEMAVLFPNFEWTKETVKAHLIKTFKEIEMEQKLQSIKKDF